VDDRALPSRGELVEATIDMAGIDRGTEGKAGRTGPSEMFIEGK